MIVLSTVEFRESLDKLSKKHRNNYGSCPKDICKELKNKSCDILCQKFIKVDSAGPYLILKFRIPNSMSNKGKSGSFRVYAAVSKELNEVVFLFVYPKSGPEGVGSITPEYRRYLVKEFLKERRAGTLVKMSLNRKLATIE